jgi:membrane-associated phospholipid phosphatase
MKLVCLKTFFIIALGGTALFAQNRYNFTEFKNETFKFVLQPLHWGAGDWMKLGLLGGVTALVAQADQSVRTEVLKNPGYLNSIPIQTGYYWGVGYPTAILAVGFGLYGWLDNNTAAKKIGFEIVQATLYAELAKSILTVSVGRARPYTDRGPGVFKPFTLLDGWYQSFPGGHATAAFALSTVLARNTSSVLLKIVAYVPAGLTAIARVYEDSHWTSDQVFGAAIGFLAASWVVDLHEQKNSQVQIISAYPPVLSIAF